MAALVEQQPPVEGGGDPVDTVRALIVMNSALEQELTDVYAKASEGFLGGRRLPKRKD